MLSTANITRRHKKGPLKIVLILLRLRPSRNDVRLSAHVWHGFTTHQKPSWFIVATKDRTIQPELERFVAKRMGATTFETDSSHVPMLSQPDFVLDVIRKAATSVQKNKAAS
jgi:pimeloyl-ACP methyl ester carboxylesterase